MPPTLRGTLTLPGDKSISHRSLLFGALATGQTRIQNLSNGQDVQATRRCLQALGVAIDGSPETAVTVTGGTPFQPPSTPLDCGNSGTTIRLLAGILAGMGLPCTLQGDDSLHSRPMGRVVTPLQQLGCHITGTGERCTAPLSISSSPESLRSLHYSLPMASAQVKSAILLAGLFADPQTHIAVAESTPARDHTERMLNAMGCLVRCEAGTVTLKGRATDLKAPEKAIWVPGDISSAAFWLVGAAILPGSQITLKQVSLNPTRTGVLTVLAQAGVDLAVENVSDCLGEPYGDLTLTAPEQLIGDITITPEMVPSLVDEIPVLTVLGLFTQGRFTLEGAEELRVKESDRLEAMMRYMRAMGVAFMPTCDGFSFEGQPDWQVPLVTDPLATHHDHRLVMSLEILNLRSTHTLPIEGREWVAVSYPAFYDVLGTLKHA